MKKITWFTDYIRLSKLKLNQIGQGIDPMTEADCDEHDMIGYRVTRIRRWFGLFNRIKKEDKHFFGKFRRRGNNLSYNFGGAVKDFNVNVQNRKDQFNTEHREHELNKLLPEQIKKYWIGQSNKKFI